MSPGTIILIAANLLPLAGVFWWGWDSFVLLMLYWLETAIIGFWTIVRVVVEPIGEGTIGVLGALWTAGFFTFHAGIFMSVHFVFLWTLFSGTWPALIHGPADFVRVLVIGTDLWLPLLILFLVRGFPVLWPRIGPLVGFADAAPKERPRERDYVSALYARIMIMQFVIIFGAWIAQTVAPGNVGPLVLLVLLKTAADVWAGPLARYFKIEAGGRRTKPSTSD